MRNKIKLLIRCVFSLLHISFVKLMHPRLFSSALAQDLAMSVKFVIDGGKMHLGKGLHVRRNVTFEAMQDGYIEIGNGCFFNEGCMIVSKEHIVIGEKASFGPNVMVYDQDHDTYRSKETETAYRSSPIIIGKRVWIGANSVILRGSVIGDGCVIGAGCVIKGTYPPGTLVVQKRETDTRKIQRV